MTFPREAVDEAMLLLPTKWDSLDARILHAAIGYQESKYLERQQIIKVNGRLLPGGPAASFWQMENGRLAGINGVLTHRATAAMAQHVCDQLAVRPDRLAVWEKMKTDDVLGAAFARMLMYTDPHKVPTTMADGWSMYLRTWRPGKPHPETWSAAWAFAVGEYA